MPERVGGLGEGGVGLRELGLRGLEVAAAGGVEAGDGVLATALHRPARVERQPPGHRRQRHDGDDRTADHDRRGWRLGSPAVRRGAVSATTARSSTRGER